MEHRYLTPLINLGTAEEPDIWPLAATVIPPGWGSDDVPGDESMRIVRADVTDEEHAAVMSLQGVSEVQ